MRQLTWKGFLASYVKDLSCADTCSINKLVKELDQNPRIKEPLILYGIATGIPKGIPQRYPEFYEEYVYISNLFKDNSPTEFSAKKLPIKYYKVFTSYEYHQNRVKRDHHTKLLMWRKITEIKKQKGISNYRIYTDLKINPGNVNCFLKNGNVEKLGIDTARRILEYVKKCEEGHP